MQMLAYYFSDLFSIFVVVVVVLVGVVVVSFSHQDLHVIPYQNLCVFFFTYTAMEMINAIISERGAQKKTRERERENEKNTQTFIQTAFERCASNKRANRICNCAKKKNKKKEICVLFLCACESILAPVY